MIKCVFIYVAKALDHSGSERSTDKKKEEEAVPAMSLTTSAQIYTQNNYLAEGKAQPQVDNN